MDTFLFIVMFDIFYITKRKGSEYFVVGTYEGN